MKKNPPPNFVEDWSWVLFSDCVNFQHTIDEYMRSITNDLINGTILQKPSPEMISIDYAFQCGILEGLKFVKSELEKRVNPENEDE